jgi:hypothetical protein
VGDFVRGGDIVGTIVTAFKGPHLHFGIQPGTHDNIAWGHRECITQNLDTVDPIPFLEASRDGSSACRNLLTGLTRLPSVYGAPFNLFAADRDFLFEIACTSDSRADVFAGLNYPQQYTYRTGYLWTGTQWVQFNFDGPRKSGDWFIGRAKAELPMSFLQEGGKWVVAFTCTYEGWRWRCGCRDTLCAFSHWQSQGFSFRGGP